MLDVNNMDERPHPFILQERRQHMKSRVACTLSPSTISDQKCHSTLLVQLLPASSIKTIQEKYRQNLTRDVSKGSRDSLIVVVNYERATTLNAAPVPHFTLACTEALAGVHL